MENFLLVLTLVILLTAHTSYSNGNDQVVTVHACFKLLANY